MPRMTGSRLFAEMMKGYGITHVFFVPTILLEALAEMDDLGIRKILTHGEKAAAYMADGYARAKNGPGVCLAQQMGASNLAAGLRDPFMACSPVIARCGNWRPLGSAAGLKSVTATSGHGQSRVSGAAAPGLSIKATR